jgi:hypothetical protein
LAPAPAPEPQPATEDKATAEDAAAAEDGADYPAEAVVVSPAESDVIEVETEADTEKAKERA